MGGLRWEAGRRGNIEDRRGESLATREVADGVDGARKGDVIRLFVGADGNNNDLESQSVLEWSVRKHASEPVEIIWMQNGRKPWAGWQTSSARTPFSHFRWSIPAVCNWEGRAIYTDSDFCFVADIAELWRQPMHGRVFLARNPEGKTKTCCMLFDCAAAKGHVPTLAVLKDQRDAQGFCSNYFKINRHLVGAFEGDWNAIDLKGYDDIADPRIKAIHYSRIEHQVHLKYALPRLAADGQAHWYTGPTGPHPRPELQTLFDTLLVEAIAHGYPPERYRIADGIAADRKPFVYRTSLV